MSNHATQAPAIKAAPVLMTPDLAAKLLKANTGNRRMRRSTVEHLVRQIKAGRWITTGDAITVAASGRLLNGQHRLAAIVEAGVAVTVLLASGLDEEAYLVSDLGARRTVSDVTGLAGPLVADANMMVKLAKGIGFRVAPQDTRDAADWWSPAYNAVMGAAGDLRRAGMNNTAVRVGFGLRWAVERTPARRAVVLEQYGHMLHARTAQMAVATATLWQRLTKNGAGSKESERLEAIGFVYYHADPSRSGVAPIVRNQDELRAEVSGWAKMMPDAYAAGPARDGHPYLWPGAPQVERQVFGAAAMRRAEKERRAQGAAEQGAR